MMSHFPAFDRLEEVLVHWPQLFEEPPVGTQPLGVQNGEAIILCGDERWLAYIAEHHDELLRRLHELGKGDLRRDVQRLRAVPASAAEIFLARQLVVAQAKLRDIELGF